MTAMTETSPQTPAPTKAETGSEATRNTVVYRPLTDIHESDGTVLLSVEMPGVAADGVEVELENRILTIRGRTRRTAPEGYHRVYAEYEEGDYERAFTLSDEIDREAIKASMRNGVLTLELPKAAEAKPRHIEVKAA